MNLKKTIKKIIQGGAKNGTAAGNIYHRALEKKRHKRYKKYSKLPIDSKLVVFESFMGRKYTDSPKAIYEYMLSQEAYNDYTFLWCFRDKVKDQFKFLEQNERTRIVRWGSEEYYSVYAQAKYWFPNTRIPSAIDIRAGQVYTQCWHGTPLKKLGCDIETEATEPKEVTRNVIHNDVSRYTHLISPSPFFTKAMTSAFDLEALGKKDIIIEEGYPRNDGISNHTSEDVKRIKKELGIDSNKKVVLYAPTYRENQREENIYTYSEPLDFSRLQEKIGNEYVILFRAHYYIAQEFKFDNYPDFIIDVSLYPEINDLYIVSDLLITDYSSVFFDFGILERPIIFYMHDLDFYREELRGLYLSLEDLPGPITRTQEEMEEKIVSLQKWATKEEYVAILKEHKKRFNPYEDGCSTERTVKKIINNPIN